jgi:hypothetical protein
VIEVSAGSLISRVTAIGRAAAVAVTVLLAVALVVVESGCGGGNGGSGSASSSERIPQPALDDPRVAPEGQRVDTEVPTFSNPTEVTNPLFPISKQESVLLLGRVDGERFRTEVTLLPETRIIEWQGQRVEVLVSQYVAYTGGRLHEVAYDFYAQDDSGAVWYFGEDVFNFKDGLLTDTHGTWIAGKDGPAAMIMPADPQVGDVYRPENIPGLVFEEVTVKQTDLTLHGPLGPVEGGLKIEELHLLDKVREEKTFGPGYGEFLTGGSGDVEAISLAVPTDRLEGTTPAELTTLQDGAARIHGQAKLSDSAAKTVEGMNAAWQSFQATGEVPSNIAPLMSASLEALARAVDEGNQAKASRAAIEVARSSLDLQLRHRPATEIDLARFDLWLAQLGLDAKAGDPAQVNGDFFVIDYIRDRIQHTLGADLVEVNTLLDELNGAVADEDLAAAAETARHLREVVSGLEQTS